MLVFISSTYHDLIEERGAARQALSEEWAQGWGMESFNSSPEKPLNICIQELRKCQAMVLIIGAKAGSMVPLRSDLTYTGAEFEAAEQEGIPIFPFIYVRDGVPANDEETGPKRDELDRLRREAAERHTPQHFTDSRDLREKVANALHRWTEDGRPGARKTFASVEEYFAKYNRPGLFFDLSQTLVGRTQQIAELQGVLDGTATVALLQGRGGIGKTKLLYEFAKALSGIAVAFLRRDAHWHRESDKELPRGDVVVIADDAHLDADLQKLCGRVQTLRTPARKVKLIIGCRPRGLSVVEATLAREFDPSDVTRLTVLESLAKNDVRRLAEEELGLTAPPDLVEWLVEISADSPLVTVAGARVLRRGNVSPAELRTSDEFKELVYDRFVDELDSSEDHHLPIGKLVALAAALSPEPFSSDSLVAEIADYLRCAKHEVRQALGWLDEKGLFVSSERGFRIAPDALADRILERACITATGPTGFAEFVLSRFSQFEKYGQILASFAEVDYRLTQRSGGGISILDGVWTGIVDRFRTAHAGERIAILDSIHGAAPYKPSKALEICRVAIATPAPPGGKWWVRTNSEVLTALPKTLHVVSYHPGYLQEAVLLLLELWRAGIRGAAEGIKDLSKLRPAADEPDRVNDLLDAIEPVVSELSLYGSETSILDVLDNVLDFEIEWHRSEDDSVSLWSYPMHYPAFKEVRERAFLVRGACLSRQEPRIAMRSLQSLMNVLFPFTPRFGRKAPPEELVWQDNERLFVLAILARRLSMADATLPLRQQIFAMLRQRRGEWCSATVEDAIGAVMSSMPETEEFASFDAFMTCYRNWRPIDDVAVHRQQYTEWVSAAVDRFVQVNTTPQEQIARLETMTELWATSSVRESASDVFVLALARRHPSFIQTFLEYVSRKPVPRLGHTVGGILSLLRFNNYDVYVQVGTSLASHPVRDVALGVVDGIAWPHDAGPREGDLDIIESLSRHTDPEVRVRAASRAGCAGRYALFSVRAAQILSETDLLNADPSELWMAIGRHGTPVNAFNQEQMNRVLSNLVQIERIDQNGLPELLLDVASAWPELVAELLIARLECHRTLPEGRRGERPWGRIDLAEYFGTLPASPRFEALLRGVRNAALGGATFVHFAHQLFWAIAGSDPRADDVLREWRSADTDTKRQEVAELLARKPGYKSPRDGARFSE